MPGIPYFKSGDIDIKRLSITSTLAKKDVDIKAQCVKIDLYEDISKPFLYAEFKIVDGRGLLDNLPIIGQEVIHLTFETPGLKTSRDIALNSFSLVDVVRNDQSKMATYTIRACSPTMILNSATYISKAYKDTIANMVNDVVTRYAQYSKPLFVEPTKGTQNIIVPKVHPYQAVDFLRRRASSLKNNSSAFLFFENQNGLYFITLEELILNNQIGSRHFMYFETAEDTVVSDDYRSVIEYHCESRYDLMNSLIQGGFATSAFVFDFITKARVPLAKFATSENFTGLGGLPNNTGDVYKALQEVQRGDLPKHFVPHDSFKPDTYIAETQMLRDLYLGNFVNETTILVHGDASLKAGEKVNLSTPIPAESKKVSPDRVSGNYIVGAVRHIIELTDRPNHKCSLGLMSDSYRKI